MTTVEFKRGRGWGKSNIGWFWGGMTVQVSCLRSQILLV
jgi:hypothetical protein